MAKQYEKYPFEEATMSGFVQGFDPSSEELTTTLMATMHLGFQYATKDDEKTHLSVVDPFNEKQLEVVKKESPWMYGFLVKTLSVWKTETQTNAFAEYSMRVPVNPLLGYFLVIRYYNSKGKLLQTYYPGDDNAPKPFSHEEFKKAKNHFEHIIMLPDEYPTPEIRGKDFTPSKVYPKGYPAAGLLGDLKTQTYDAERIRALAPKPKEK